MPLRVLLLVNSEPLRELVSVCLSGCGITLASWPTEVPAKLALGPYSLVIVTNFGVSPWEAVRVVPEHRDYPVLFLTGHVDDDIRTACTTKHIPIPKRCPHDLQVMAKPLMGSSHFGHVRWPGSSPSASSGSSCLR